MAQLKETVELRHPGYVAHSTEVFVNRREFVAELLCEVIRLGNRFHDIEVDLNRIRTNAFDFFDSEILRYATEKAFVDTYSINLVKLRTFYDKFIDHHLAYLNLSKTEKDLGVRVDNPSRPMFIANDQYSPTDERDEFIDLDALSQNIVNSFIYKKQISTGDLLPSSGAIHHENP